MSNPVAVVTAASQGIGAACAKALRESGHDVVVFARSERLNALAESIGAVPVIGSVTEPSDLARLVDHTIERFGRIDVVVNNTGHPAKGPLLSIADDDWHAGLDLVLLNVIRLARLVVPVMTERQGGVITNISTFGAVDPALSFPLSSTLRAALSAFVKLFSREHGPHNIRMNNVLPGFVDSYPVDDATLSTIPAGRLGHPHEIGDLVAFLASPQASYITGQNILIDGGLARGI